MDVLRYCHAMDGPPNEWSRGTMYGSHKLSPRTIHGTVEGPPRTIRGAAKCPPLP